MRTLLAEPIATRCRPHALRKQPMLPPATLLEKERRRRSHVTSFSPCSESGSDSSPRLAKRTQTPEVITDQIEYDSHHEQPVHPDAQHTITLRAYGNSAKMYVQRQMDKDVLKASALGRLVCHTQKLFELSHTYCSSSF